MLCWTASTLTFDSFLRMSLDYRLESSSYFCLTDDKVQRRKFLIERDHNQLRGEWGEIRGQSPDLKSHLVPI